MSAYNWIEINEECPSCRVRSVIKCQTHFCSSYDGNGFGRFHDRHYKLGDIMAWWEKTDHKYPEWVQSNSDNKKSGDVLSECCYSNCLNCEAELFVVIKFNNCSPMKILEVGLESDWPEGYLK